MAPPSVHSSAPPSDEASERNDHSPAPRQGSDERCQNSDGEAESDIDPLVGLARRFPGERALDLCRRREEAGRESYGHSRPSHILCETAVDPDPLALCRPPPQPDLPIPPENWPEIVVDPEVAPVRGGAANSARAVRLK